MDPSDWPPGCESDAGYYGVRVGETDALGIVPIGEMPAEQWYRVVTVAPPPIWYSDDLFKDMSPFGLVVVETQPGGPPSNPWTRYGLNAREYGWHLPRPRA